MSKHTRLSWCFGLVLVLVLGACRVPSPPGSTSGVVTRQGTALMLDGQRWTFSGLDMYNAASRDNCWYRPTDLQADFGHVGAVTRVWFFQGLATTAGRRDWSALDAVVAAAKTRGVRIIAALGDQAGMCEPSAWKTPAWYASGYKTDVDVGASTSYLGWVFEVAAHFAHDPTILALEPVNEPEIKTDDQARSCAPNANRLLFDFMSATTAAIKYVDPSRLVGTGVIGSGQCGADGSAYQQLASITTVDLCSYHDYGHPTVPVPGDAFNGLALRVRQCAAFHKPVYVGEMGIGLDEVAGDRQRRARLIEAKLAAQKRLGVVGGLVWSFAEAPFQTPRFENITPDDPLVAVVSRTP